MQKSQLPKMINRSGLISSLSSSSSFADAAGGEAHRGGEFEGSQGGALHHAPEPVHPQHPGGLPAERRLRLPPSDQEAAHVHVLRDAHAPPSVSKAVIHFTERGGGLDMSLSCTPPYSCVLG